jgi:hypothetical protein
MDLVAVRLQAGKTEEAFNVLPQVLSASNRENWRFRRASAVKQAMQLVCLLSAALGKGLAPAESRTVLERFATGVAGRLKEHGLPDEDGEHAAKSLSVAAAALSSEAFDNSLVALLSESALRPNQMEACLAAVGAARPPALQQRMMEAVMGSVLPWGQLSASLERDACAALASALCGGPPHLPQTLVDPFLGPFAAALLAHKGCPSILREVLQKEAVQEMAYDECIAALVRKRIGQVESDIQAFLRDREASQKVGQGGAMVVTH